MASRTITQLISDLSGEELEVEGGENIQFAYRGVEYSIDLTTKEVAAFDKAMSRYVEHAARLGGRRRASSAPSDLNPKDVRAWAKANGLAVPDRGRVPLAIVERYRAEH